MAGEWRIGTLREALGEKGYIRGPFGSALRRPELKTFGIPVYEQQHAITGSREFRFFIDEDKYEKLNRFTVQEDDLIVSCSGTLARISMIKKDDPKGIISQALLILRPDKLVVCPKYLYYFMSSPRGFNSLVGVSTGSVQVNIAGRGIIEKIEIPLPPLLEQQAIACILGTLDDKIELNRKMNQTLEEMARAIFKSWFVDFDPVRAKAAVRRAHPDWTNEQISRAACPKLKPEIAELFPDTFEDSELGEIPKGWRVGHVGDLAYVSSGKRPEARYTDPSPAASVPLWGGNGPMGFVPEPLTTEPILLTGRVGTLGSVFRISTPCWPSDNTLIIHAKQPHTFEYLFLQLQKIDYTSLNRGSTQPLLTQTDLQSQWVILPAFEVLEHFSRFMCSAYGRIDADERESRTLAAIRDALLPKLISGELRIRDVDKIIERI